MTTLRGRIPARELRLIFGGGALGHLTDGELLERFVRDPGAGGEQAFGALVDRHGPMVLRVCRGILRDPADADDACQATFLVLARKAGSLWTRDSIGPWLLGVARRVSHRSRCDDARRRRHERGAGALRSSVEPGDPPDDFEPVLVEEVDRLPDRFRSPIVLCHLQGLTHEQAADRLGWPVGTVRSRLARGRDRLRARLEGRGISPLAVLPPASAAKAGAIRAALSEATTEAAARVAAGGLAVAGASPAASGLARSILRTMIMTTTLKLAAASLALGLVATGAAGLASPPSEGGPLAGASPASSPRATGPAPAPAPAPARRPVEPPQSEAERIAGEFLDAGSELFDAKDAPRLADTYATDGEIHLISKNGGEVRTDVKRGRAAVEQFYADLFRKAGSIDSENTVEFARQISPDVLVVNGRFRPNAGERELPFVQMRVKQGDRWLLRTLWLFLNPEG
ncbi:RNA polymerase sigma factor [Tautonia plasticadhaerens]|uniref:ECF RNA polymerase sigma factor SigW n=1 Tax=Tautonia plasticadhaerens TaxID=2527974 RepID=A0A518HD53_9BACT|nr:RNA polymerase sigma factor [Tautonia plasticadhaerens]QDV38760.1 ECF RNA polymerase sigma factor SigW [Tautonia plasticadhaerens]